MPRVYISTFGCQMNEYDSEQMLQVLSMKGFVQAKNADEADLILINSCSVREKSENKALSDLGRYARLKSSDKKKVIGFGGCVGQTEGPKLLKRYPFLDFAFGTNNYRDLPEMIAPFEDRWAKTPNNVVQFDSAIPAYRPESFSRSPAHAFLTITNGCDKFCSYCIVPFTRGREVSRSPEEILNEASHWVSRGVVEIMLLGQNVNSYWGKDQTGRPQSLYDLLKLFQKESEGGRLQGLKRLRYTTSHPRDFNEDLARAFTEFPIVCEYLHLPFQSGSNEVLRRMRRFYSIENYLDKMRRLKEACPSIALSTDIIVGFPGETDEDFENTMKVMRELEFDNVYAFKYSVRPYTRSAKWEDDVAEEVKTERINELFRVQKEISRRRYESDVGKEVEVLFETPSKSNPNIWTGRTRQNRLVHVTPDRPHQFRAGQIAQIRIESAMASWLRGTPNSVSSAAQMELA